MAEKEMTTADLDAFLKIPPEQHFRSQESALKAADIWRALSEASTDPIVKSQWLSASENALKTAERLTPARIHNSAIGAKKALQAAKKELASGEGGETVGHILECNIALMNTLINKPTKKDAGT